jgi:hypothetical protein
MRNASLRWDYPLAHGVVNELGQRMDSKLKHDVSPVCLSGPRSAVHYRTNTDAVTTD